MIYRVGQKVVLLKGNSKPGTIYWFGAMRDYVGKTATLFRSNGERLWRINRDDGYWWHEEWMQPIGCPCNVNNCITKHNKDKQ